MSLSLPNQSGDTLLFSPDSIEGLLQASRESPRLRMMQPIQRSQEAPVQRLLNALQPGTYVRPHKHPELGASETVVIIRGALGVLIFDAEGEIVEKHVLSIGDVFDIEPGVWHGMVCIEADTVMAEFKQGPYNPRADKFFADWSPAEDDGDFVRSLEKEFS